MILTKKLEDFINDFSFIDSTISDISWDTNLLDLLITVDYFWDILERKENPRVLTLRFKNCTKAMFNMPKVFHELSKELDNMSQGEHLSYILGWYTITEYDAIYVDGLIEASFQTVDSNPRWLSVECEEIWIESLGER
jgi:hypothetical protein